MKRSLAAVLVAAAVVCSAGDGRAGENLWYSVLVPGWGQTRSGHYGRGALFVGAEVLALTALALADLQYDRSVEQYNRAKAAYLAADYIGDALEHYDLMRAKWEDAENLHRYRQIALGAAVGVWIVNIVDIALFDERREPPLAIEPRPNGFAVSAAFSF